MSEAVLEQTTTPVAQETNAPVPETMDHADYRAWRNGGGGIESVFSEPSQKTSAASAEPAAKTETESETARGDESNSSEEKGGGVQKRIDRLIKDRSARDQRIADLERQLADQNGTAKKTEPARPQSENQAADGPPKAGNFETYEEYIEKLTDWKIDQRDKAKTEAAAKVTRDAEAATQAKAMQERQDRAREKYADWNEIVLEKGADIPISQAMHEAIATADDGPELAYFLGKNPAEAARIAKLSPYLAAKELGRISARLEGNTSATENDAAGSEKSKAKTVSEAPPPIRPVGSRATSTVKRLEDLSGAEYRAARESGRTS